jgi:hypothetical protein
VTNHPEPIPAPPAGEDIHMPDPTILPFINAIGLTLVILGVTFSWIISAIGGLIFLGTTIRWITDVRRDIAALPVHHEGAH